jgi:hypothetical protein
MQGYDYFPVNDQTLPDGWTVRRVRKAIDAKLERENGESSPSPAVRDYFRAMRNMTVDSGD